MPEGCPDPILAYNFIMDFNGPPFKPEEADVLRAVKLAAELGFEVFVPDAMWFPQPGDWRWDPPRFPRGVRPIEQFVHDHGLRLGLWCAWTNGGLSEHPDALSVRRHADWFDTDFGPDWRPAAFIGGRLCLASAAAQRWATKTTQRIIAQQKLDYFKHDIDPLVESCDKKTHQHRYGVDVSYWATIHYYEIQEAMRAAFPNLILENCSGGGRIKDYGAMQRAHYIVSTDTLSNLPNRQSIYDSSFAMPPLVLQCYTLENYYGFAKGRGRRPGTVPVAKRHDGRLADRPGQHAKVGAGGVRISEAGDGSVQAMDPADPPRREGPPRPLTTRREDLGWDVLLEPQPQQGHTLRLPARFCRPHADRPPQGPGSREQVPAVVRGRLH